MRRAANTLIHSIKDGLRGVRYSIRAEAETPGSEWPRVLREVDFGPLTVIGSAVGIPAIRLADGLIAQAESVAGGLIEPLGGGATPSFPCAVSAYFDAATGTEASFSSRVYGEIKRILARQGVRHSLISEAALDAACARFSARHRDVLSDASGREVLVQACAGLACALNDARPIQRVTYADLGAGRQPFMLSPNLYCGLVIGLATAVVTVLPEALEDRDAVIESAESAVGARLGRFKQVTTGKAPITDLAAEFETILPFLP